MGKITKTPMKEAKSSVPVIVRKKVAGKTRFLCGWKPDRPDHRDLILSAPPIKAKLPLKVDLSTKMSRIEDQADIGSCVANSSTTAIEYLYKQLGKKQPELSRLFVYYFARLLDGTDPNEDSGTYIRTAMKSLATYGVCTENIWPYDTAKYNVKPDAKSQADGLIRQILRYYRTPTLIHTKMSLSAGYPVVFGFSVPETLFLEETSETGIVQFPTKDTAMVGGHAVLAVGYDERKQLLKFQNSWGNTWGDKGYGYLPYKFVTDGLADDFWTVRQTEVG